MEERLTFIYRTAGIPKFSNGRPEKTLAGQGGPGRRERLCSPKKPVSWFNMLVYEGPREAGLHTGTKCK